MNAISEMVHDAKAAAKAYSALVTRHRLEKEAAHADLLGSWEQSFETLASVEDVFEIWSFSPKQSAVRKAAYAKWHSLIEEKINTMVTVEEIQDFLRTTHFPQYSFGKLTAIKRWIVIAPTFKDALAARHRSHGMPTTYGYWEIGEQLDDLLKAQYAVALTRATTLEEMCYLFVFGYRCHRGRDKLLNEAIMTHDPSPTSLATVRKAINPKNPGEKWRWERLVEMINR